MEKKMAEHVATFSEPEKDTFTRLFVVKFVCSCGHPAGGSDRDPQQAREYAEHAFEAHKQHPDPMALLRR